MADTEQSGGVDRLQARLVAHAQELALACASLEQASLRLIGWGRSLAEIFRSGGRLLLAGNGGCNALADHLSAELIGRFEAERAPLSAINLQASPATVTAAWNDFEPSYAVAGALEAHGRPGDVLLCLSTSGASVNLLEAVHRARELRVASWALAGLSGPVARAADDSIVLEVGSRLTVQELQLAAIHSLCFAIDYYCGDTAADRRARQRGS